MTTSHGGDERDDIDARFADIVARWDDPPEEARQRPSTERSAPPADPAPPAQPAAPNEPAPREPRPPRDAFPAHDDPAPPAPDVRHGPTPHDPTEPVPWRQHIPTEDDEEEGFVPPPPSPLPPVLSDWTFYLALVGLVGGPLWLLYLVLVAPTEHRQMWAAGALTIAGFVTLVFRQPHERDPDDDDDGARV